MRYVYLMLGLLFLFGGTAYVNKFDRHLGTRNTGMRLGYDRARLSAIGSLLHQYKNEHGRYPSNDEKIFELVKNLKNAESLRNYGSKESLISVWGEPYIYENRNGLSSKLFADSGATIDKERRYSVEVDNGIYMWSIVGEQQHARYLKQKEQVRGWQSLVVVIASIFFLLFVWQCYKVELAKSSGVNLFGRMATVLGLNALMSLLIGAIAFPLIVGPTCYAIQIERRRTPQQTKDYIALITKYRDRGIISDKAYAKMLDGIKAGGQ